MRVLLKQPRVHLGSAASRRPTPPGDSKSSDTRYIDIHEGDKLDEAQIADRVKQAAELPGFLGASILTKPHVRTRADFSSNSLITRKRVRMGPLKRQASFI